MKKLLIALAAVLVTAATYAQGTINFNTRFSAAGVDAPVALNAVGGPGPGPTYSAGLFLKAADGSYSLLPTSLTTFRDGTSNPLLAKYITSKTVEVPGVTAGPITVQMRAWLTSSGSFDAAANTARGSSTDLTIASLGGGPIPPGDLPSSFTGFVVTVVPEPSTIALGAIGAAALLLRRRK